MLSSSHPWTQFTFPLYTHADALDCVSQYGQCSERTAKLPGRTARRDAEWQREGVARHDIEVERSWSAVHSKSLGPVGLFPADSRL